MTRIFVMESCPDCIQAKQIYGDNPDYEIIDIGKQARDLKEFLSLRDNHPAFKGARERDDRNPLLRKGQRRGGHINEALPCIIGDSIIRTGIRVWSGMQS